MSQWYVKMMMYVVTRPAQRGRDKSKGILYWAMSWYAT